MINKTDTRARIAQESPGKMDLFPLWSQNIKMKNNKQNEIIKIKRRDITATKVTKSHR